MRRWRCVSIRRNSGKLRLSRRRRGTDGTHRSGSVPDHQGWHRSRVAARSKGNRTRSGETGDESLRVTCWRLGRPLSGQATDEAVLGGILERTCAGLQRPVCGN